MTDSDNPNSDSSGSAKPDNENTGGFTQEQTNYLQGFALGADVARTVRGLPVISNKACSMSLPLKILICAECESLVVI